jgi:pimeloyl-ACP methyl ester carboxylesterase
METVEVDGLRIAYRRTGTGPALLLVHGGLGDSRDWRRQLEGLGDEFTVVAWDAPGCGGSSDPPESFRLPDYADCLAGFAAALGIGRAHVCGLSFGGGLALELYRRHPGLPRSLVLASAYAGWAGSLPPEVVRERLDQVMREAELPPEQWVRGYLSGLFTEAAPRALLEEAEAIMLAARPAGMRAMARTRRWPRRSRPSWSRGAGSRSGADAELAPLVPDPAARAALIGSLRPRGLAFFTEPLPPAALLALAARM